MTLQLTTRSFASRCEDSELTISTRLTRPDKHATAESTTATNSIFSVNWETRLQTLLGHGRVAALQLVDSEVKLLTFLNISTHYLINRKTFQDE